MATPGNVKQFDNTVKTKSLHFTVDPDGITRLIREMWQEGSYDKAFNVLGKIAHGYTIPIEQQYDILRDKCLQSLILRLEMVKSSTLK